MSAVICGSRAFDTIMTFEGRFSEQILPDQLHILNVSFLVPALRREFGGCAGNIAYSLRQLGGRPLPMATVGSDGAEYVERMKKLGISTEFVREVAGSYTAQAMIMTDGDKTLVPPVKAETVLDPTGCGDAFRGALLYGLEQGWSLARCAALGNQMGALKIATRGGQNYALNADQIKA